jgi:flagellar hook-associated protein 1
MGSLSGSMSIALSALLNNQEALDVTSNNIANQNTQGYTRQRVNFSESATVQLGSLQFGTGAQIDNIQSVRDQVLDFRINSETQTQSALDSFLTPMQQVQSSFNEAAGTGLQSSISGFFSSLSQLSTNPSSVPLRQSVLTAGQNLAGSFNTAANNLNTLRASTDQQIPTIVQQVNTLAQSVAQLNIRISQSQAEGQNTGALEDQRQQVIQQMSQLINISMIQNNDGSIGISTALGAALVVGGQEFNLQVAANASTGQNAILSSTGKDLTANIDGGQLGGLLRVRDQGIPALTGQLDTLANSIATAVNNTQTAGFDLNSAAGQNFFTIPATVAGAAQSIQVNLSDPSQVAASLNGSSGDNSNVLAMSQLQNQNIVAGDTPLNFYSNTVAQLGSSIQQATAQSNAQDLVVQQLQTQRNSVSGVSLDEEATNLIQFQRAYQAAARVVNVVDELTQTAINLGVGGT